MLTPRQLEVLKQMKAAKDADDLEDAEIVSEGIVCYLGLERISRSTLNAFIEHCLVSLESGLGDAFQRWTINEGGEAVCRRPELADELWVRIRQGGAFTFANDRIKEL